MSCWPTRTVQAPRQRLLTRPHRLPHDTARRTGPPRNQGELPVALPTETPQPPGLPLPRHQTGNLRKRTHRNRRPHRHPRPPRIPHRPSRQPRLRPPHLLPAHGNNCACTPATTLFPTAALLRTPTQSRLSWCGITPEPEDRRSDRDADRCHCTLSAAARIVQARRASTDATPATWFDHTGEPSLEHIVARPTSQAEACISPGPARMMSSPPASWTAPRLAPELAAT